MKKASIPSRRIESLPTARNSPSSSKLPQIHPAGPTKRYEVRGRPRISIHREPIVKLAQEREGRETAKPTGNERLSYAGNEIKGARRGDWRPDERDRHPNKSDGDLRDSDLSPLEYPVMEKGGG